MLITMEFGKNPPSSTNSEIHFNLDLPENQSLIGGHQLTIRPVAMKNVSQLQESGWLD